MVVGRAESQFAAAVSFHSDRYDIYMRHDLCVGDMTHIGDMTHM
jgi:hypothetical protein